MIFNKFNEDATEVDNNDAIDTLIGAENPDNIEAMADEVEAHMTAAALEAVTYFEGGQEAVDKFEEALEMEGENGYVNEARRLTKKTYVRLNKSDDLQRRSHLACLVLAKAHKDPLWTKLALNRIKERKLRNAIYKKYGNKANMVAKKSQLVHIRNSRKLPALPKIQF